MSTAPRAQAEIALRHLAPACDAIGAEVIVVRAVDPGRVAFPVISELGWQLLEVPAGCTSAQMRAEGMATARGDIVAFRTDANAGDGVWLDAFGSMPVAAAPALEVERVVPMSDERVAAESRGRRGTPAHEVATTRLTLPIPWERPITREF